MARLSIATLLFALLALVPGAAFAHRELQSEFFSFLLFFCFVFLFLFADIDNLLSYTLFSTSSTKKRRHVRLHRPRDADRPGRLLRLHQRCQGHRQRLRGQRRRHLPQRAEPLPRPLRRRHDRVGRVLQPGRGVRRRGLFVQQADPLRRWASRVRVRHGGQHPEALPVLVPERRAGLFQRLLVQRLNKFFSSFIFRFSSQLLLLLNRTMHCLPAFCFVLFFFFFRSKYEHPALFVFFAKS